MTATQFAAPLPTRSFAARVPAWGWLALGVAVTALVGNRFNIAVLGWVAAVPWLLYLRRTDGWKSRALFALALAVGTNLQIAKIITEPIPWFFAPMFALPMSAVGALAFIGFESVRRRLGDAWGLLLFPAMEVGLGWVTANTSEMGSWGSAAYTQLDNLPLLQTASLFGLAGLTGLLALTSALAAVLLDAEQPARFWRAGLVTLALVVSAHIYGGVRLYQPLPGPLVKVATVTTDLAIGTGALPGPDEIATNTDTLFARSDRALREGAAVVVWNEGGTLVEQEDEDALLARGRQLADTHDADLVLAYVVPLEDMRRFENKYVWFGPDGEEVETYFKHHPVPGEGSVKGEEPIVVHERPYGRAAGAICYDYDFPSMGRAHAAGDAGVVVVPSSDWLGIDPYHTQMAAVRGVEGGFSVVRSVRWATSGAFDAHGRARGLASWFEGQRVMMAEVPAVRVPTLYSQVGEVLPLAALLAWLAAAVALVRRRGRA